MSESREWTVVVRNNGPGIARGVRLVIPPMRIPGYEFEWTAAALPAGVRCPSPGTGGGGMAKPDQVDCTLGDLAPGRELTLRFTGHAWERRPGYRYIAHDAQVITTSTDAVVRNNRDSLLSQIIRTAGP